MIFIEESYFNIYEFLKDKEEIYKSFPIDFENNYKEKIEYEKFYTNYNYYNNYF